MISEIPILIECILFEDFRGKLIKPISIENQKIIPYLFNDTYISISKKNVFRGLHYQEKEFAQEKLFTLIKGEVKFYCLNIDDYDVYYSFNLQVNDKLTLYVPKGWATGFHTLGEENIVYFCSNQKYSPNSEISINFSIIPELKNMNFIISDKDNFIKD